MYPDYVKTIEDKIAFCKANTKKYSPSLDLCVAECGIEEVLDPITGDCSTLKGLQDKMKDLQAQTDVNYTFYAILLLSLFTTFILYTMAKKRKEDDDTIYYGLGIYGLSMLGVLMMFGNTVSMLPVFGTQMFLLYRLF